MKPLAVDLYCGLGGWTEGLLAEGWRVRGYDIEEHVYGDERYPGELVLRDVLEMHGSEIADADLIVSSSPCTEFSYRAMPWKRSRALAPDEVGVFAPSWWDKPEGQMLPFEMEAWLEWRRRHPRPAPILGIVLFDAQFRLQREANEIRAAMGLPPIPMVVENVRGAQDWVGQARANFGSYYLWGDVPALLPQPISARKNPGFRFDGSGRSFQTESVARHVDGVKVASPAGRRTAPGLGARFTSRDCGVEAMKPPARVSADPPAEGRKGAGAGAEWFDQNISSLPSGSSRRKAASAKIAKIPFALSSHIARVYRPATTSSKVGQAA